MSSIGSVRGGRGKLAAGEDKDESDSIELTAISQFAQAMPLLFEGVSTMEECLASDK